MKLLIFTSVLVEWSMEKGVSLRPSSAVFFFYWVSVLHLLHPQVYEEDEQLLSGWDRGSVQ